MAADASFYVISSGDPREFTVQKSTEKLVPKADAASTRGHVWQKAPHQGISSQVSPEDNRRYYALHPMREAGPRVSLIGRKITTFIPPDDVTAAAVNDPNYRFVSTEQQKDGKVAPTAQELKATEADAKAAADRAALAGTPWPEATGSSTITLCEIGSDSKASVATMTTTTPPTPPRLLLPPPLDPPPPAQTPPTPPRLILPPPLAPSPPALPPPAPPRLILPPFRHTAPLP